METVQSKLESLRPGGLTALLDAINLGLDEMKKAKNPRKALVVISDGGDNSSHCLGDLKARWRLGYYAPAR
jgi:Ca-activated chloride channel family protein